MLKKLIRSVKLTITSNVRLVKIVLSRYTNLTLRWVKSTLTPFLLLDLIDIKNDWSDFKITHLSSIKVALKDSRDIFVTQVQTYVRLFSNLTDVLPLILSSIIVILVLRYVSLDYLISKLNLIVVCSAGISFYIITQTILIFIWGTNISLLFKTYIKPSTNIYV